VDKTYPNTAPTKHTVKVKNFKCGGKTASLIGEIMIQFKEEPPIIANPLITNVATEQYTSLSLIGCRGEMLIGPQTTVAKNRRVYLTVSPVAKKNKKIMTVEVGE